MQEILGDVARKLGKEKGFVKRQSAIDGEVFVKTIVFTALGNPSASLSEMARTSNIFGSRVTIQGLDQRFTKEASECLKGVLEEAVSKVIKKSLGKYPVLDKFEEIYVQDSTTIVLPDVLKELWRGIGGDCPSGSALKIQFQIELKSGSITFFDLTNGRANDPGSKVQHQPVTNRALSLFDLGYWDVKRFKRIDKDEGYFLSRLKTDTNIYSADGERIDLQNYLHTTKESEFDIEIILGADHKFGCRMLARRVPPEVSNQRRRILYDKARKKGVTPSQKQLALCDWTVLVTNIPKSLLSIDEALVIIRVRWQVELIFKFWKSDGAIDKSRSKKPFHILCDVYGKLIAVIIKHWILLCSNWHFLHNSLFNAGKEIQVGARMIAHAICDFDQLCQVLSLIASQLERVCNIGKRKQRPSTIQRLQQLNDGVIELETLA